jgi:hypothetical protein
MDIVERLRLRIYTSEDEIALTNEAADKIERIRSLLKNPTEEMLKAGRAANRLVAGNSLGLACIAPDSAWSAMANLILTEDW